MKINKNYLRKELVALKNMTNENIFVFTGRYKHRVDPKWAIFTTIRVYDPNNKTKTICSHININRKSVERCVHLSEEIHNRKFYICGKVSVYEHYGDVRGCITLSSAEGTSPIWLADRVPKENEMKAYLALYV